MIPFDKWRPIVLRWISRRTIRSFTFFYLFHLSIVTAPVWWLIDPLTHLHFGPVLFYGGVRGVLCQLVGRHLCFHGAITSVWLQWAPTDVKEKRIGCHKNVYSPVTAALKSKRQIMYLYYTCAFYVIAGLYSGIWSNFFLTSLHKMLHLWCRALQQIYFEQLRYMWYTDGQILKSKSVVL